jgi:hypothetical protein
MAASEKPRLVVTEWGKGEPVTYKCSRCSQIFILPDDRTPKEAAAELIAAFHDHVGEVHGDETKD